MSALGIKGTSAATAVLSVAPQSQPKTSDAAAKQFEALLIGQMLRTARETMSSGLSGEEGDSSTETMFDLADQQFAQLLANNGGLGLAKMITRGLDQGLKHDNQ
ncbi:MAG: rod-binding protein [Bryobacteraceae bacterium]|jgi:Rod binding domain-containing protein